MKTRNGNADFAREIRTARAVEERDQREGRRARSVAYNASARRIHVELSNGIEIAFPLSLFAAVADAPAAVIRNVMLSPSGAGIEWEDLDAHYSVPGLLAWAAGTNAAASTLGREGGKARSDAKVAAARANGARGGRPRRLRRGR